MVRRRGDAGAGRTVEISLPRPTAVLAAVALFAALAGGAYAAVAVPSNSVGTNQLKNGAVTLSKVSAAARGRSGVKEAGRVRRATRALATTSS